jgi:hypothetical protein
MGNSTVNKILGEGVSHRPPSPHELTNPKAAFWYAYSTVNGPFPAGEPVIATSAAYSVSYARHILKKPFPPGEPAIATSAEQSLWYARYVLKKPFPPGEPAIATSAEQSVWYAIDVLNKPFPAGEEAIAQSAYWAWMYAKAVLKGPFPAGEETIAKSAYWAWMYAKDVLKAPFPPGERAIIAYGFFPEYVGFLEKCGYNVRDYLINRVASGDLSIEDVYPYLSEAKSKSNPRLGKCYLLSGRYVSTHPQSVLVHGTLTNPSTRGYALLPHAWVLEGDEVFDPVMDVRWPKIAYYSLYKAKEDRTYTHDEVLAITNRTGTWGPWDE